MRERLSAEELAGRAGQPPELVERLVALGIVTPGEDGWFPPGEVTLVLTMVAFEESGIALEDVAAGVTSGDLDYSPIETYFPDPPPSAGTVAELAARLGRTPASVGRLLGAFGLPQPTPGDAVRRDDAATLEAFLHAWPDVSPPSWTRSRAPTAARRSSGSETASCSTSPTRPGACAAPSSS
jgi:hypothetical protein